MTKVSNLTFTVLLQKPFLGNFSPDNQMPDHGGDIHGCPEVMVVLEFLESLLLSDDIVTQCINFRHGDLHQLSR